MSTPEILSEKTAAEGSAGLSKPYKGVESFEIEDGGIFFGRSLETDQLIFKILANKLTLLHARSGAGKSSLLNARITPGLELRGHSVVRSRPGNDPDEGLRVATVTTLLPPPATEALALRRACSALGIGLRTPLSVLLKTFDGLPPSYPLKRSLQAPIAMSPEISSTFYRLAPSAKPICLRLLRATMTVSEYREHVVALCTDGQGDEPPSVEISEEIPVNRICEQLADPLVVEGHTELLERISLPALDLYGFFQGVVDFYGSLRTHFAMVLILDQFEELFTRFSDPGPAAAVQNQGPHWRLRWNFLDQLERLYSVETSPDKPAAPPPGQQGKAMLPLRLVIAMRDEYIAELDSVRRTAPWLDNASFHLTFLNRAQAAAALAEPAALFSYRYSEACQTEILNELSREDRFIEPAQLQIVCENIWNTLGKQVSQTAGSKEIGLEMLPPGSAQKILNCFFTDFLAEGGFIQQERMEMLEMLELLVTPQGTRNILEKGALIHIPFRDQDRRARLLDQLLKARILQRESKLSTEFVEITHEFLIRPILDTLQAELGQRTEFNRLRLALKTLEGYAHQEFRDPNSSLLTDTVFSLLDQNREAIEWTDWSVELMLRCAVRLGLPKPVVKSWCDRFALNAPPVTAAQVLAAARGRETLSLEEMQVVNSSRDQLELSPDQIDWIMRSEILRAQDTQHADVKYWTRKLRDCHGT